MPWSVLIPRTDPKQTLRIRRYLLAAGTSLLVVLLLAASYSLGMLELPIFIRASVLICALTALIYGVFRSGLNRHFSDPSLAMEQTIIASTTVLYIMYQADGLRDLLLPVYLMPLLFGMLWLDRVRLLLLASLLLAAYAGMVLLCAYTKPSSVDAATEVTLFVVLCIVLPWLAVMGGYFHSVRARLSESRNDLRRTLTELQQTNQTLQDSHAELERRASTDRLTGAWNRRRLDEAAGDEMVRLQRYGHALCLLFLDIDFFKEVNDRHGHAAGDQVLIELAARIRSALRGADSLTRWGGEEFLVLCPDTGLTAAASFAERLRNTIAATKFSVMEPITVSIGVAECLPEETWERWFERADAALYRAKAAGRNRVKIAPETPVRSGGAAAAVPETFVQLVWHRAYECGHEDVDGEHKALFRVCNDLLAAILSERSMDEVLAIADALVGEVAQHFRDEESIIGCAGYPAAAAHAAIHRELANRAVALVERLRADKAEFGEVFQFLAEDVVAKHILAADRDFFPYLENQRRKADRGTQTATAA